MRTEALTGISSSLFLPRRKIFPKLENKDRLESLGATEKKAQTFYYKHSIACALDRFWGHLKCHFPGRKTSPEAEMVTEFWQITVLSESPEVSQWPEDSQVSSGSWEAWVSQGSTVQGIKSKQATHSFHGQGPPRRWTHDRELLSTTHTHQCSMGLETLQFIHNHGREQTKLVGIKCIFSAMRRNK